MANQFEKDFEAKFDRIRAKTGAFLHRLHPPMRVGGMRGSLPCFVQIGRALFDVAGWIEASAWNAYGDKIKLARTIGIELKENGDSHSSMRIVGDDGSGSGLQAHQLEALASVHRNGGIARVLWNNGGVIAVLDGDEIAAAHFTYGVSVQAEKMRKKPALGSRSIPWRLFRVVDFNAKPEDIIATLVPPPTAAQELKQKRRKVSKQIDEAQNVPVDPETYSGGGAGDPVDTFGGSDF